MRPPTIGNLTSPLLFKAGNVRPRVADELVACPSAVSAAENCEESLTEVLPEARVAVGAAKAATGKIKDKAVINTAVFSFMRVTLFVLKCCEKLAVKYE